MRRLEDDSKVSSRALPRGGILCVMELWASPLWSWSPGCRNQGPCLPFWTQSFPELAPKMWTAHSFDLRQVTWVECQGEWLMGALDWKKMTGNSGQASTSTRWHPLWHERVTISNMIGPATSYGNQGLLGIGAQKCWVVLFFPCQHSMFPRLILNPNLNPINVYE